MSPEELKKKREEKLKIREECDRYFFCRLGRFALASCLFASLLILPVIASWRTFEQDLPKDFFWKNFGLLLLGDLYVFGALLIVWAIVYLAGGSRGTKLCGIDELVEDDGAPIFLLSPLLGCVVYVVIYVLGNVCRNIYYWVNG